MEHIREDLRELQRDMKALLANSAVHNTLLETHEARSLALQKQVEGVDHRIQPLERHVLFVEKFLKWGGAAAASLTGIEALKHISTLFGG